MSEGTISSSDYKFLMNRSSKPINVKSHAKKRYDRQLMKIQSSVNSDSIKLENVERKILKTRYNQKMSRAVTFVVMSTVKVSACNISLQNNATSKEIELSHSYGKPHLMSLQSFCSKYSKTPNLLELLFYFPKLGKISATKCYANSSFQRNL